MESLPSDDKTHSRGPVKRSASDGSRTHSPLDRLPKSKRVRLNSTQTSSTSAAKLPSMPAAPVKKIVPRRAGIKWEVGAKVDAMDYLKNWYPSRIIDVDANDASVLIHFEGWNSRFDEWLEMRSDRLRPPTLPTNDKKEKVVFPPIKVGETVLAKWTDMNKYPAEVIRIDKETLSIGVRFYDGVEKTVRVSAVQTIPQNTKAKLIRAFMNQLKKKTLEEELQMVASSSSNTDKPSRRKRSSKSADNVNRRSVDVRRRRVHSAASNTMGQEEPSDGTTNSSFDSVTSGEALQDNQPIAVQVPLPVEDCDDQSGTDNADQMTTQSVELPKEPVVANMPVKPNIENSSVDISCDKLKPGVSTPQLLDIGTDQASATLENVTVDPKEAIVVDELSPIKPSPPTAVKEPTPTAVKEPTPTAVKEPTPTAVKEPTPTAVKEPTPTAVEEAVPLESEPLAPNVDLDKNSVVTGVSVPSDDDTPLIVSTSKESQPVKVDKSLVLCVEKVRPDLAELTSSAPAPNPLLTTNEKSKIRKDKKSYTSFDKGLSIDVNLPKRVIKPKKLDFDPDSFSTRRKKERTSGSEGSSKVKSPPVRTSVKISDDKSGSKTESERQSGSADMIAKSSRRPSKVIRSESKTVVETRKKSVASPDNAALYPGYVTTVEPKVAAKAFVIEEDHNPYKCTHKGCDKAFRKESLLASHMKHYHVYTNTPINLASRKRKKTISMCSSDSEISVGGGLTTPVESPMDVVPIVAMKPMTDTVITNPSVVIGAQSVVTHIKSEDGGPPVEVKLEPVEGAPAAIISPVLPKSVEDAAIINCICGCDEEMDLMVQCELCMCWQHASCFNIPETVKKENYICFLCSDSPSLRDTNKQDLSWFQTGKLPVLGSGDTVDDQSEKSEACMVACHKIIEETLNAQKCLHAIRCRLSALEKSEANHKSNIKLDGGKELVTTSVQHLKSSCNSEDSSLDSDPQVVAQNKGVNKTVEQELYEAQDEIEIKLNHLSEQLETLQRIMSSPPSTNQKPHLTDVMRDISSVNKIAEFLDM